jgi:penicillin-binding protein 1C
MNLRDILPSFLGKPRRIPWARLSRWAGGTVIFILAALFLWPLPSDVLQPHHQALRLLDRNGALLYEVRPKDGTTTDSLAYADIPQSFLSALISTEDRTFYSHFGVSVRGTARALWQDLRAGEIVSGGSTITQQLVRLRLPPAHRGIIRKLQEMLYAVKLERHLPKNEILAQYANGAYFGHQAYGLSAAAKIYFGKRPDELSIGETAYLVGLLQSPSSYDPFQNPKPAVARWKIVLRLWRENGGITSQQEQDALKEGIHLASGRVNIEAPHFVFWLLQTRKDLPTEGDVRTTIDLPLQRAAEDIIRRRVDALKDKNVTSGAAVVLDTKTGDVLAMVGSADYFDTAHEGAVNAAVSPRQPGSAVKPFTYALAFAGGATPATTVPDVQTQFLTKEGNPYVPRNYDYEEHGLVRYREALANSYNIAAVRVLQRVGVSRLLTFLRDAGITTLGNTPEYYGLALTLGDAEVTLLDLATSYAVFPRGGETLRARTLLTDPIRQGRGVIDAQSAWLVTDILSDNAARLPEFGGDSPLAFSRPVAAKTGTTRNARDNWTMGYTPDRVVGVWVGNANNAPMRGTSGVTGAGPIFHDVMEVATQNLPKTPFERPAGIVERDVCRLSGMLPTPLCPSVIREVFEVGTEPTANDDVYQSIALDRRNGLRAGPDCPSAFVEHRTFAVLPPDVAGWARDKGWPQSPTAYSPLCQGTSAQTESGTWLRIVSPEANDAYERDPLIPAADQKLILRAQAAPAVASVEWFANGRKIGAGTAPDFEVSWQLRDGFWTFEARTKDLSKKVTITVQSR